MRYKDDKPFELVSPFRPAGDQPQAIDQLVRGLQAGSRHQVLLGVTGSGKTFTMANVIAQVNRPALVLAHNKTLAAQLYSEFKELFPKNAVEYFISYYDYYQPEAYIPGSDTYIEKDSSRNEEIDKMRHAATRSLLERRDVVIVASVSCIYGIGSPDAYGDMLCAIETGEEIDRDMFLRKLVEILYQRNDVDFARGTFRVRGDTVEVFPAWEMERAIRVEFFGDEISSIRLIDALTGTTLDRLESVAIYPASHYVVPPDMKFRAIESIKTELRERLAQLRDQGRMLEAERLDQRTTFDLEMIQEVGTCPGIENYSRHLTGRKAGDPPATLLDYFPRDFLLVVDESHQTIPQVGAMFKGDRSRKETLVEYGFRLPSALDNRPLNFQEFEGRISQAVHVSATPGDWELQKAGGVVVEQIVRPTGLVDPAIEIRPATNQVENLLSEVRAVVARGYRVFITTLTKRMAEHLSEYYANAGVRVKYLHSDIDALERVQILRELRLGEFDVLVGINLLREGLDIPEVALVAILDADKEGFLRGRTALIQTFGRAARNVDGRVVMYGDTVTKAMEEAIAETDRRRRIQTAYNEKHGIIPQTIVKAVREGLKTSDGGAAYERDARAGLRAAEEPADYLPVAKLPQVTARLEKEMREAAKSLDFEKAAALRDRIRELNERALGLRDDQMINTAALTTLPVQPRRAKPYPSTAVRMAKKKASRGRRTGR
ncbi:MAG: excinuclease ABC subunit UvrB [Deltaproteobacteria bacterium]|nr:excinuclease ABC subunit UvrB [Deltaproteobacteria bacterium]